ncbi:hypothetical protein ACFWWM_07520, partial [Streptomyces sp. NPDC058682]
MNVTFTTPRRPVEVTALFPQLAPLARPAVRLHPRAGSPSAHDSSVGGARGGGSRALRRGGDERGVSR